MMQAPALRRSRWSSRPAAHLLALVLLSLGALAPAGAEVLREETISRYPLDPGGRVSLRNVNGDVEFSTWERDEVLVEATRVVRALGHGRAARALEDLKIEVDHQPDALEIRTRVPRRAGGILSFLTGGDVHARVTYSVTLPRGVTLEASTVNGDVRLDAVAGEVSAETVNGQIQLVECAGAARASTTNGNIRADFVELGPRATVELRTTNGGIAVSVPPSFAAEIDASTVNGAVNTDFAVLVDGSSTWRRKSLRGAINGGGGQLTLETVNGSIQLRKRDGA